MPPVNTRVLVWDSQRKLWIIGRIIDRRGEQWWVMDPQIFHAVGDRFTIWQDLPGDPNVG